VVTTILALKSNTSSDLYHKQAFFDAGFFYLPNYVFDKEQYLKLIIRICNPPDNPFAAILQQAKSRAKRLLHRYMSQTARRFASCNVV
jgi:hypothetical protein